MTLPAISEAKGHYLEERKYSLAQMRDIHYHQIKYGWGLASAGAVAAPVIAEPTLWTTAFAHQPMGTVLVIAGLVSLGYARSFYTRSRLAAAKQTHTVFLPSVHGLDPEGAVAAVDDVIAAIKTGEHKRQKLADEAFAKLQRLRPGRPLSHLKRYGYYPDRPKEWAGDKQFTIDRDSDAFEKHWQRMSKSLDGLRTVLDGHVVVTENEVDEALASLIAPMRAALRASGIDTSRIEYLPEGRIPETGGKSGKRKGGEKQSDRKSEAQTQTPAVTNVTEMQPEPIETDVLTPVETRMNASAAMTAATLRTLMLAFRQANPGLFLGDDQTTGSLLVERHLPDLVGAYVVAHDAASGEQRDEVRADFARTLATIRDTLHGIMERHVQAARQVLVDQGRFIESRHASDGLDPVDEAGAR